MIFQHEVAVESRTALEKLESELCKVSGVNLPNSTTGMVNSGSVPPPDLQTAPAGNKISCVLFTPQLLEFALLCLF